jgi:hypothetical protein
VVLMPRAAAASKSANKQNGWDQFPCTSELQLGHLAVVHRAALGGGKLAPSGWMKDIPVLMLDSLHFAYRVVSDRRTPWGQRLALGAGVAYAVEPGSWKYRQCAWAMRFDSARGVAASARRCNPTLAG